MSSENLVVAAKCLIPRAEFTRDYLKDLNYRILDIMEGKGYISRETSQRKVFLGDLFLAASFYLDVYARDLPPRAKIRKILHLSHASDLYTDLYFRQLKGLIDEAPHKVTFTIQYGTSSKGQGFAILIESEPAIVAKKRQLNFDGIISDSRYDEIVSHNQRFIKAVMNSFPAIILEEPGALKTR